MSRVGSDWHVTVRRGPIRWEVVRTCGSEEEAIAWLRSDPRELVDVDACQIKPQDVTLGRGEWWSLDRHGKWRAGRDNYYVVNENRQIVAGFDEGNAAIAWRTKHEPARFAWSVEPYGIAKLAGLTWWDEPVFGEHLTAEGRLVVTYHPREDDASIKLVPLDGRVQIVELRMDARALLRTVLDAVPAEVHAWDASAVAKRGD